MQRDIYDQVVAQVCERAQAIRVGRGAMDTEFGKGSSRCQTASGWQGMGKYLPHKCCTSTILRG
ncbi:hypothetical protein [Vreelandella venusta]|uniref:hypothetical protein n=1 Tax=Vreelandella venusta TaxID=44935 RepID=UPI003BF5C39A